MPELGLQRRNPSLPVWVWVVIAAIVALLIVWVVVAVTEQRELAQVEPRERVAGVRQEQPDVVIVPPPPPPAARTEPPVAAVPPPVVQRPPAADDRAEAPAAEFPVRTEIIVLPVDPMLTDPAAYIGKPVTGRGTVVEIISDRAFWVAAGGQRILVVKDDEILEAPALRVGDEVILEGRVYDAAHGAAVPDIANMPQETRQLLERQPAFIYGTDIDFFQS